ncbi:MAG: acyl carrier protein [Paludibacteraceae bacterium]|nr:acyl carrier protein [Paludibacteraceae bacterium]
MEKEFIEKLREVLEIEDHEINMSDEFRTYDEWDSLAYLSLIAMLDEEYDIQMEEAEFKKLRTIEDLYKATLK